MGRTYFISPIDTQVIADNFDTLLPMIEESKKHDDESVFAFFWEWFNCGRKRRPRWGNVLDVYSGKRSGLLKNSTECDEEIYRAAKKLEGVSTGWDEPTSSEFCSEANNIKQKKQFMTGVPDAYISPKGMGNYYDLLY